MAKPLAAVVLAAGLGKRMGAGKPKVLLPAAGRPLLAHVLDVLRAAGVTRTVVVEGPESPRPSDTFFAPDLEFVAQAERRGTGHAVLQAQGALADVRDAILVVHGDMPLLRPSSIQALVDARTRAASHGALLVARTSGAATAGLGRVFVDREGTVERIAETRDLAVHPEWGTSDLVNVGAYLFGRDGLWEALSRIHRDNAQGEHYLTDVVAILRAEGRHSVAVTTEDPSEALGVNTVDELARVEEELRAPGIPEGGTRLMCGIVGYAGPKDLVKVLMDGLSSLEYRGYDSAGIALSEDGGFRVLRRAGKLQELRDLVATENVPPHPGSYGIGHTRWATHGRPNDVNAHPHRDCHGSVLLVHNGIIENHAELKAELMGEGHRFVTETDSEVIAHLIERELSRDAADLADAVRAALPSLAGAYSIVCVSPASPGVIVGARSGPPLVVGFGDGEGFLASDITALLPHTRDVAILGDGEMAIITRDSQRVVRFDGTEIEPARQRITWDVEAVQKGGYAHFMRKEIAEQPEALRATLLGMVPPERGRILLPEALEQHVSEIERVVIVACGTSLHAAMCGRAWIEQLARIPTSVEIGSEYRYGAPVLSRHTLALFVTQSGETADTLASLREAKRLGAITAAITNVTGSMVTREAHATLPTLAGPEIGVAATKTFMAQLGVLYALALALSERRGTLTGAPARIEELLTIPHLLEGGLHRIGQERQGSVQELAVHLAGAKDFLFLGRGLLYPIALEGALKLKEISYIHAEGYPAGELKHGPIALIDETMPVVALVPGGRLREKILSNVAEVKARGGILICVCEEGDREAVSLADHVLFVPRGPELLAPFLYTLPMQLLAYHAAVALGCDVDQPRNLAKSVTVE